MAYQVRETSGVLIKPSPGKYSNDTRTLGDGLALANSFTTDRDSGKRKPPLTADTNQSGKKGGRTSKNNALRLQTKNNGRRTVPHS